MADRRVFISYSHDDDGHKRRVREFADALCPEGFDVVFDQYVVEPPEGWTTWMERGLRGAARVLLVCLEPFPKWRAAQASRCDDAR